MNEIMLLLARAEISLVDEDDYERLDLAQYSWHVTKRKYTKYAVTNSFGVTYLHQLIMGPGRWDHKNGDGLDNRKCNLRAASRAQNRANGRRPSGSHTSIYKGVSRPKLSVNWQAFIKHRQKTLYLGSYVTEREAALAYNKKALELFGEFAKLNEISVDS